ncbi:MAG: phosphate/phosphite/phosphonate ABC transporter substrate-binding protein [Candidatus Riflebacteria bacterium]|nr:phosphate/phosphite/phosphonate ABC transporter substrate-binding protein [Candidatus Riflebacteria bacterium]
MGKKLIVIMLLSLLTVSFIGCCKKNTDPNEKKGSIQPSANTSNTDSGSSSSSPYKDQVLRLGRIPYNNSSQMVIQHEAFLKYLAEKIGVKAVRLQTAPDYSSILKKLVAGEIDIAWMASLSAVEARNNPEVEMLCKPVRYGTTSYRGIVLARQDSGIRTLRDLKNKKFAWVDKESASAYLFPKAMMLEANIDPDRDFAEVDTLGKHDNVVYNVLLGKYDAGACYDDARNTLKDKSKRDELIILATTQDISNEPLVCRKSLPQDLRERIKSALLSLNNKTPEGREILKDLADVQGFVKVDPRDYDSIEKVLKALENHKKK